MKARRAPAPPRSVAQGTDPDSREGTWRTGDLPEGLQAELGARLLQAEQGQGLISYDEALAEVDRMAEEILAVAPATSR